MPKAQQGRARQAPSTPVNPPAELVNGSTAPPSTTSRASGPSRRPTYPEAVARYEHGMRALQAHDYKNAAAAFRSVLTEYPEEKELNDRVRLYLALCDRHLLTAPEPNTQDERLYAATLALNAGDADTAVRHLSTMLTLDPEHDGALYMLGVIHALKDDPATALAYLRRAIERNPDNRALALQDGDLERLMQDESIRAALEAAGGRPTDTRTQPRARSIR